MNKPPQPITGPTSVPNPAPSPGLTQAAYGPGQPQSLVFATPPPPQMNSAPQPRQFAAGPRTLHQQGFYANRPTMPSSAPRVQTSSGPRAVGPTHVYPSSSQMMMISQQQLSFAGSPQGYFIPPGQYRPPYMAPTQQYPVTSGTTGFYPGTSPAEYQAYEPSLAARERRGGGGRGGGRENGRLALHGAPLTSQRYPAGAYYPAQPQFSPSVQPTPVMINPAQQQQQQAPPPQQPPAQPQGPIKRERKPIRIRDPNQGGRDITEEIMSGGRSSSTPTPPQTSINDASLPQTNGEVIQPVVANRDDGEESSASIETPPPTLAHPEPPCEAKPEMNCQDTLPEVDTAVQSDGTPPSAEILPVTVKEPEFVESIVPAEVASEAPLDVAAEPEDVELADTVDAPVAPSATEVPPEKPIEVAPAEETTPEEKVEKTEKIETVKAEPDAVKEPEDEVETTVTPETLDTTPAETNVSESAVEEPAPPTQSVPDEPEPKPTETAEPPLSNGIPQDLETEDLVSDATPDEKPASPPPQEPEPVTKTAPLVQELKVEKKPTDTEGNKKSEQAPSAAATSSTQESTMQAATSVPKKRRNMKEINKKEAIGDLLDAFTEQPEVKPAPEPVPTQAEPIPVAPAEPPAEVVDETWEEQEDKLNAEPDKLAAESNDKKEEQWKPLSAEDKKRYDRDFLLGFQFSSASINKPEGLPVISDVVLDKINKTPMRPVDPSRLINVGPDFTPSYLGNLGSRSVTGPRGPPPGPRRSQQGQRKEPRKIIISSMSLSDEVQLKKAEHAWKPTVKKARVGPGAEEPEETDDPEAAKTQEVFKRLRSILNKLTPQKFQDLIKQVLELPIDTEERLKGAIDLIFEKAISEPNFSVAYANMCRCLMGIKVPNVDAPGEFVNFRKLLLNRCQKEFEKDQDDDEIFERKQKELEAAKEDEERERLRVELKDSRDQARRRSLGNIKFIGELFKLKMLTEAIMHDCVVKLLKNHDEESLECLCRLLSTIGKDLDFEKAKPRMDQYFNQMDKIIKERKTSSRIRFMLQDVLDLRKCNWVPRRADQGPKTIDQIHKDAEMEEHREQAKVQQAMMSRGGDNRERGGGGGGGGGGGRMDRNMGGRGPHSQGGQRSQPQDEGWNTVPISKHRPIDTNRLSKITKPGALDLNNQLLAPGGKGMWGSWGKGSSGGSGAKPAGGEQDSGRPATSTLNRFSALQQSGSTMSSESDRRVPQRSSSSRERGGGGGDRDRERYDRFDRGMGRDNRSGSRDQITKRSFSRETEERGGRGGDSRATNETVRRVASMTDDRDRGSRDRGSRDRGSRDRGSRDRGAWEKGPSKDVPVKRESAPTPPLVAKPALSEEELEKKANAIIEEYLHLNDMKEAIQCVAELNSASLLFVFVRCGLDSTLERSPSARERLGLLLHDLVKAGTLTTEQFYKALQETLEVAEDMAIDIPHIWLYLAEVISPMLLDGGIPMDQLFREVSKPLLPLEKADVLLVQILKLLCKGMTPQKVGAMWKDAGLNWTEFLPKGDDVAEFVAAQKMEFTTGEVESEEPPEKAVLSGEEIGKQLDRLLQDKANNQRVRDWVEANLDEQQIKSNQFVRALMMSVCQSSIICDNPYKVDTQQIKQRASLLQPYLLDEEKELQALYALQALMVHMEQPANLLRMFFDALYDEDVIKEDAFYKWETSKDPAEQTGKGVALKSATAFFSWLREAEEESDKE